MNGAERGAAWLGLGVFAASLVVLAGALPGAESFVTDRDQGNQLAKATQIALGRHPFLDFRNGVYGPLIFYSSRLGQLLSGGRPLGEAILLLFGYAGAYTLLFLLLRKITRRSATAVALVALAMILLPRFYKYYIVLGPVLFATSLRSAMLRPLEGWRLVALAAATDVAGLYRLDFGVYALATAVLCIALDQRSAAPRPLARYTGWCLLFASPWLLFLALHGNLLGIVAESLQMTSGVAAGMALEPPRFRASAGLGAADNRFLIAFWYTRFAPLFALLWIAVRWRRFPQPAERTFGLGLAVFAALVFLQASHRVDPSHLRQVLPVQIVLLAWLAVQLGTLGAGRPGLAPALCTLFVLPLVLLADAPRAWTGFDLGAEKFRGLAATRAELRAAGRWRKGSHPHRIATVARVLHDASEREEGVLVLPFEPQLYWLADRGFTTSFGWLNPGRFPERADQERFVRSMADTRIVADLSNYQFIGAAEPDARDYAELVMRTLYEEYAIFRQIGTFYLLTDDAELLASAARFPAQLRPLDLAIPVVTPPASSSLRVTRVNTLPVDAGSVATSVRGGGLTLRMETVGDPIVGVALRRDGVLFFRDPGMEPGPGGTDAAPGLLRVTMGTRELAAGTYDVLVLRAAPGKAPAAHDTGQDVRLRELEPGPR